MFDISKHILLIIVTNLYLLDNMEQFNITKNIYNCVKQLNYIV